jgi:glycine oxidase
MPAEEGVIDGLTRTSYDAVVVGAGAIGLASAWRIARGGASVAVLERDVAGAGASGVAAGMLAPVTEADFGERALLRLNLAGAARWPAFARELEAATGATLGHRARGALVVAADRDDAGELRRLHALQRELGLDAGWLAPSECRRLEPALSPRVAGGILAPHEAQVDPRALVAALVAACRAAGVEVAERCEVAGVEVAGGAARGVRTAAAERVAAGCVVLAAGAWTSRLDGVPPGALPRVRPVKGQLIELRAPGGEPLASRLVRTPRCYVVDRGDGRVVVGATMEERGFDDAVTAGGVHRLLEAAWEVLPEVEELELGRARAGLRPGSPDNAPLVGEAGAERLVVASGHHRNGILLAPLTADAVAALAAGEPAPAEVAPFAPERFASRAPQEALA